MKLWIAAAAALTLAACSRPAGPPPAPTPPPAIEVPSGAYTLDAHHSNITVRALHYGLSYYSLRFNTLSGTLNFNADDPAQSSVEATVAVTSLDTPYSGDRDFDSELQNSSWLDGEGFPTATFRSTAIEVTGANAGRITGDLTLKGATHPITLDVTFNASHRQHPVGMQISMLGFSGRGTITRSQFGINEMMPRAGGNDGIGDQVEILIEAEFTRPIETDLPASTPVEPVN